MVTSCRSAGSVALVRISDEKTRERLLVGLHVRWRETTSSSSAVSAASGNLRCLVADVLNPTVAEPHGDCLGYDVHGTLEATWT